MSSSSATAITDLPDEILSHILSAVSSTRARNSAALVSHKWRRYERLTRTSLALRGNLRDLHLIPSCFPSVTQLDLSLLSPWGHPLLSRHLALSFPSVTDLSLYLRTPTTLSLLTPHFPKLTRVKLVRFHQRPPGSDPGSDFTPLFSLSETLLSLDLSSFYCWTEDIPPAIEPLRALTDLNLLNPSLAEGYKSDQIKLISSFCPNLKLLKIPCMFDHRYIGFVDDDCLLSLSSNCPKLQTLHLVDASSLLTPRNDPSYEGYAPEDASIGAASLIDMFSSLPLLEDLVLDLSSNMRESRLILEQLGSKCPNLKTLKLGHFHGVCSANDPNLGSRLDGLATCHHLEALSIKNSADLTDFGLVAIAKGCTKLSKFEIEGCRKITSKGMRLFASLLCRSLVDVKISCCEALGAVQALRALDPVQDRVVRLHIDAVWDNVIPDTVELLDPPGGIERHLDLNKDHDEGVRERKRRRMNENEHEYDLNSSYYEKTWDRLRFLSIWVSVGEVLTPLPSVGLENCPVLEEIVVKIEGDSRDFSRPSQPAFGLSSLSLYPMLTKLRLDCKDTIGYAHTAPSGHTDLSLWERFFLNGIGSLSALSELDYWPPQDRDVNQRSLSLPAVGLLGECTSLRKLFIHGTAHEHFMMEILRIPKEDLRDVQLREDYYPAPEDDMSTGMRENSCSRFENALNRRRILD